MKLLNLVSRCVNATGYRRYKRTHAADNVATFCGKEIDDGMWFIEQSSNVVWEDVTCQECKRRGKL